MLLITTFFYCSYPLTTYYIWKSCQCQYILKYNIYNFCNILTNQHRSNGPIFSVKIELLLCYFKVYTSVLLINWHLSGVKLTDFASCFSLSKHTKFHFLTDINFLILHQIRQDCPIWLKQFCTCVMSVSKKKDFTKKDTCVIVVISGNKGNAF